MNVKHVIGLAAIVLGGMTSCSNILEEEGFSNSGSNGDQSYLAISLDQNKEISVLTKSGTFNSAENKITLSETEIGEFKVEVKNKTNNSQIPELTGTYSTIKGKQVAVDPEKYSLSATYGSMAGIFAYDSPCFTGSKDVTVEKGKLATGHIECTLSNSIIQFPNFTTLTEQVNITTLVAVASNNVTPEVINNGFPLYENDNLKSGILYVQSNVSNAKIVLQGSLKSDSRVTFTAEAKLENTDAAKLYNISYNINSTQGSLTIEVSVNGEVKPTSIEVNFDPYNPTPSQE